MVQFSTGSVSFSWLFMTMTNITTTGGQLCTKHAYMQLVHNQSIFQCVVFGMAEMHASPLQQGTRRRARVQALRPFTSLHRDVS